VLLSGTLTLAENVFPAASTTATLGTQVLPTGMIVPLTSSPALFDAW
jgi:hypothetical protein